MFKSLNLSNLGLETQDYNKNAIKDGDRQVWFIDGKYYDYDPNKKNDPSGKEYEPGKENVEAVYASNYLDNNIAEYNIAETSDYRNIVFPLTLLFVFGLVLFFHLLVFWHIAIQFLCLSGIFVQFASIKSLKIHMFHS